jgi:hypothetical protein
MQNYGTPFILEKGNPDSFPDFTIEYLGEREVEAPKYIHRVFRYKDYKITSGEFEETISWTSGTGLLAPLKFVVLEKKFSFQPWGIDHLHKEISIVML